jgi:3-oxoacyl-[acyl-carrier protein] reductase
MKIDLQNKIVLVTGAARGIGAGIAESLTAEGAHVVAIDLPGTDVEWHCDVTDTASVQSMMDGILKRFGTVDVLVNNAGINAPGGIESIDADFAEKCFAVNVGGVLRMAQAVLPTMKANGHGRIINAASFAAIMPAIGGGVYAASKAAVVQLTRAMAGELGPWNITVNAYAPGMIPTSMNGFASMPEERQAELLRTLTLRRWGTPKDVADLVCFLASDAASYITGALIDVSGGKFATQMPWRAYELAAEATAQAGNAT